MIWFHMSRMSKETVVVIDTRFIPNLFIIWRYNGCNISTVTLIFVVCFVNWWGYKVVCVSRYCASFVFIFWYSNVNIPCTLFPCSKFSHRVFIWQGFLTRQGYWMIDVLMIHPFPDLWFKLMLIWMLSFDQVTWCCYAEILRFWVGDFICGFVICYNVFVSASSCYYDFSIYACYDFLWMVMFGALLVDSFWVPHVFRVLKWF